MNIVVFTCCNKSYLSDYVFSLPKLAQVDSMSDKRAAIIELHRAGKTNSEIIKLL